MKKIIQKIIEMLANNIELGKIGIGENLVNWLKLGADKFEDLNENDIQYIYENNNLTEKELRLIYEINPYVEQLTHMLVKMWEREESKEV